MERSDLEQLLREQLKSLPNAEDFEIKSQYRMINGKTADLLLLKNNRKHSLWKFEDKIDRKAKERTYLSKSDSPFQECGERADFRVFFDGDNFVLNNLRNEHALDEHFDNIEDLFQTMQKKQ